MSFGNRYSALGLGVLCAYLSAKGGGKLPFPCSFASHHCKIWHYNPAEEEEGVGSADPPAPVRKNGFLLDSKEPDWSKLPPQGRQPQHGDRRKEMLEDIAILTGGGTALIRAAQKLESVKPENEDEKLGIEIIRRAVEEPLRMIVECCGCRTCRGNAGLEGSVVVNEVKNGKGDYGYNARAEKYENLFQSGVIDPAKERESSELSPRGP